MIITIITLFLFNLSFAGDRAGNGGDVVVCPEKVVMLDYYEAQKRNIFIKMQGRDIREKVYAALERYKRLDTFGYFRMRDITELLVKDIENFEKNKSANQVLTFFTDDQLTDISDSNEITLPRGCYIDQLIISNPTAFTFTKMFTINRAQWEKLNDDQKSLAIIHEVLYWHMYKNGWNDSRFARFINSILNSDLYSNYLLADFINDIDISQTTKMPFLFLENYGRQISSSRHIHTISSIDFKSKLDRVCQESIVRDFPGTARCYPVDLNTSLSESNQFEEYEFNSSWGHFKLIPYKVIIRGDNIIGYEAIIAHISSLSPISVLRVREKSGKELLLSWGTQVTLNETFDTSSSTQKILPTVFVDLNGNVKLIFNKSRAIEI
jgi:hypothetical protein